MKYSVIFFVTLMLMIPSLVSAQSASQIVILTDKQSYTTGDTISISGTISSLGASSSAVLQVYNPFNVLVQIGTINVASDGTFSTKIKAQGQSWGNDGSYEIKVLYVSTPILATATKGIDFKAAQTSSAQSLPAPQAVTQVPPPSAPPQSSSSQPQISPTTQQTNTQNITQTIKSDNQTAVEEQIQQRIALANKLKQQLDQSTITEIPFWVKDTARKWHDETTDNAEFSKVIQYFISSGLIKTNGQITPADSFEHIPSWVREVAGWWSQGLISDNDYINSIQFLLDQKIIRQ